MPLLHRRQALCGLAFASVAASPFQRALAQPHAAGPRRVGLLGMTTASGYATRWNALRKGLQDLGWVADRNLIFVERYAAGALHLLPGMASELIAEHVEVLVTHGIPGTRAAVQATKSVPIVMAAVADPVAAGFVASYAQPGGNVTGLAFRAEEMAGKRMQFLRDALPRATRVAVLFNPRNPIFSQTMFDAMQAAAVKLRLTLQRFDAADPQAYPQLFAEMAASRPDALSVTEEASFNANIGQLAELALQHRLPAVGTKDFCEAGGLIGYGADFNVMFERAAFAVHQLLRGAQPGELPIEQPTRFELAANLSTARLLGLKLPDAMLLRVDTVLQ